MLTRKPALGTNTQPSPRLPTPYSLLPPPYSLLPTPYSLLPTPYSLLPTPYSLLPTPYSLSLIHRRIRQPVRLFVSSAQGMPHLKPFKLVRAALRLLPQRL